MRLWLALLLLACWPMAALQAGASPAFGKKTFTKQIQRSFATQPNSTVALSNQFGKVNVKSWTEAQTKIDVTITVQARDEDEAEKIFRRISVDFSQSTDLVRASTQIESSNSSWWNGWDGNSTSYSIDYDVMMPRACHLDLSNKYGDSYVQRLSGNFLCDISYGNLQADLLEGETMMALAYGKANLGELRDAQIESKYSKINIGKALDVAVDSKYDTYDIGTLRQLRNQGKYDRFHIDAVEDLRATSAYTDYRIGSLRRSGDCDLSYGSVHVEKLQAGFQHMAFNGKYSTLTLYLDASAAFELDGQARYGNVSLPGDAQVSYEKESATSHEVQAHRGSRGGLIKASVSYGGIKIR